MRRPFGLAITAAALSLFFAGAALGQSPPQAPAPEYGTSSPTFYRIGFSEFVPVLPGSQIFTRGPYSLYSVQPNVIFMAVPHIPTGALLTRLELDYCDFDTSGQRITVTLLDCSLTGLLCTTIKTFDSDPGACDTKAMGLASAGYTMQNGARELVVEVRLRSGSATNQVTGVTIGYKLQVSPGPGVATFGDVPTTSPIFQFVEALYAAGITAGCGNGNFCPNSPLTRGQMAVFLATALGLHFPD